MDGVGVSGEASLFGWSLSGSTIGGGSSMSSLGRGSSSVVGALARQTLVPSRCCAQVSSSLQGSTLRLVSTHRSIARPSGVQRSKSGRPVKQSGGSTQVLIPSLASQICELRVQSTVSTIPSSVQIERVQPMQSSTPGEEQVQRAPLFVESWQRPPS